MSDHLQSEYHIAHPYAYYLWTHLNRFQGRVLRRNDKTANYYENTSGFSL